MRASDWLVEITCLHQSKINMADASPAKSFLESNITSTPEDVDIVLGKTLSDERKLELIAKLKEFPCLWETSSPSYKVDKRTKEKAIEELSENFSLERDSLRSLIHGLRSGLNRELKREAEDKVVKWKFFHALNYMKDDIAKRTKVGIHLLSQLSLNIKQINLWYLT